MTEPEIARKNRSQVVTEIFALPLGGGVTEARVHLREGGDD